MANEQNKDATIAALLARIEAMESKLSQQPVASGPRLTTLVVVGLRDLQVTVKTALGKKFRFIDESTKPPRTIEEEHDHGIVIMREQEMTLDVTEAQIPFFQAAVEAGDIAVQGMPKLKGARA